MIVLDGHGPAPSAAEVGGKAAGLARMAVARLPVPPAFVLPTALCAATAANGGRLPDEAVAGLRDGVAWIERRLGRCLGATEAPLLLSVRSGAARSMPGMMDTILNLGVTPETERALARESGDPAFAEDVGRRFVAQFAETVGHPPPADPWEQLRDAAEAVFASWSSERAVAYRRHHGLDDLAGTAVTVQAMVFGNRDDHSGTGVLFTRDPLTGAREPLGEWLPRGQGEDVVSGRHDALPLTALAEALPQVHAQLLDAARWLERDARDVQDVEFTVESGRLWLLQTRTAKRSPVAAVRLAVQLAEDGLIDEPTALRRVRADDLAALLRPHLAPAVAARATVLARGTPASPGVAIGMVVTDADRAEEEADDGPVVLARPTTDPHDVHGMIAARAILTEIGGPTSHAAVVGRELGRPCVVGCGAGTLAGLVRRVVTVDGGAGVVYDGALAVVAPDADADLRRLEAWARRHPDAGAAVARALAAGPAVAQGR